MKLGSLCSGAGGLDLAVEEVFGAVTVWHAELDPAASKVLAARWPGVPNHGDIQTTDWTQVWEDTIMAGPRNEVQASAMYERYREGVSLATVAREFNCTRQSVYVIFKRRGWELHARPRGRLFQVYRGVRYTLRNGGYYGSTTGERTLIHRVIWEAEHGPIPDGFEIHHLDHDKSNNVIDNFECLSKADHARLYGTGCNQAVHRCDRDCDEEVVPSDSPAVDILTAGYP